MKKEIDILRKAIAHTLYVRQRHGTYALDGLRSAMRRVTRLRKKRNGK